MEPKNKFLLNSIGFMILSFLIIFGSLIFQEIREFLLGALVWIIPTIVLIIYFALYLTIYFTEENFSKSSYNVSYISNILLILALFYQNYLIITAGPDDGFGVGYGLIFFIWPIIGLTSLISLISLFIGSPKKKWFAIVIGVVILSYLLLTQ